MLLLSEGVATGVGTERQHGQRQERRRGLRVRQIRPIKIYEPLGARYFGGETGDISSTGLRIELPAFATVREGETLSIHVGLNRKGQSLANRRHMIPARVVWVRPSSSRGNRPGTIEAGVEFLSSISALLDAA